jgi:carboxypeptidase family protein
VKATVLNPPKIIPNGANSGARGVAPHLLRSLAQGCKFSLLTISLLAAIVSFGQTPSSSAQTTTTGSVEGVVLDLQGKPIPGADVYALPEVDMRILAASATTDSAGKFILQFLQPGGYFVYAYKESDGYPNGFFRFLTAPGGQTQVAAKVEAGQATTGVTMKLAKFAQLKFNVIDENGKQVLATLTFTREDQPGDFITGTSEDNKPMLVPPVPFRLTVDRDGYEPWHYGGAKWQGKAGLIALKSGQSLSLAVRLRKK